MSVRHNFRQLQATIREDPERRARLERERRLTEAIIELTALRKAHGATERQIASAWEKSRSCLSQNDCSAAGCLAALHGYVAALGGQLELNAVFPDQTISLGLAVELSDAHSDPQKASRREASGDLHSA
jgi:hypothetical protein